jgi:hypothetical protein
MAKTSLQFHGEPTELLEMAAKWARDHQLSMAVEQFWPDARVVPVPDGDLAAIPESMRVDRVWLSVKPLDTYGPADEFADRNPDPLVLTLGKLSPDGLEESMAGAVTDDDAIMRVWRKILRKTRSELHKGAAVVNRRTGNRGEYPHHAYTEGALRLARDGVKMLVFSGNANEYEFYEAFGRSSES